MEDKDLIPLEVPKMPDTFPDLFAARQSHMTWAPPIRCPHRILGLGSEQHTSQDWGTGTHSLSLSVCDGSGHNSDSKMEFSSGKQQWRRLEILHVVTENSRGFFVRIARMYLDIVSGSLTSSFILQTSRQL